MAIPSSQSIRSESQMVPELCPVMPVDLFRAVTKGDSDVLIRRFGLQPEEQTEFQVLTEEKDFAKTSILNRPRQLNALSYPMVTIEASHSAPEQIKTEHQTIQSELRSATRFGDTVLHLLVTKGHNELALIVFRRDVSLLKSPNKNLETPLHSAAKFGNEKVIHNLIQIDPVAVKDALEQPNENGDTALHVAAKYNNVDISLTLMKLDPEVAYRENNNMFSALNVAIDRKYTKLVQTMLEQDHALAYTQFSTGMFPVHLAASTGNKELVLHLMEKNPECAELLDPQGRNFFHVAAEENMSEIFREIFKNTSVREMIARMNNAQDCEGNTPLHIAAMKGNMFTMEAISENKMDNVAETILNKMNNVAETIQNKMNNVAETILNKMKNVAETILNKKGITAETILNKEGLTALELSRRQQLETYKDSDTNKIVQISKYVDTEGFKFTPRWFEDIMVPQYSNDRWERTQVVGLGSVLITTVAFAAAFTIPGGYNQDHGIPVLGRRYIFRAFILADALAFIQGSLSLFALLLTAQNNKYDRAIPFATISFVLAASSMIVAFGLGLYVTLAHVCYPIAVLILVITLFIGSPIGPGLIYWSQDHLIARPTSDAFALQAIASIVVSFLIIFCLAFL